MKQKSIIFLDIDGVLNSSCDKKLIYDTFEVKKLKLIFKLLNKTRSHLVIISSRSSNPLERKTIEKVFKRYRRKISFLENTNKYRAKEIIEYLKNTDYSNYVIIDDNEYDYHRYKETNECYIPVDCITGITVEKIKEAYELLKGKRNA